MTTLSPSSASRPTMVDVAREAEVSLKTVSRVVNGEAGVSAQTAKRVNRAIARLGFQRNASASGLRRGTSASIGLVVEDLANPFYSQLAAAVEREARAERHLMMSTSAEGDPVREAELVAALLARQVDGLVVVPAARGDVGEAHRTWGTPLVYVDRPGSQAGADSVLSDNAGGIRSAVEHLAARGHRRIGFLGDDPAYWTAGERELAFRATHRALGLPGEPRVSMGPQTVESVDRALAGWTSGPDAVTALVTGNNRVTVAALRAVRRRSLCVSLVGYDDFELADLLEPAVTVVHQDPAAMGRQAAHQLFARIRGDTGPPRTLTLPTRLLVRASVDRVAS
ncbi:MAG TPA: LacI family DNA-binding transcriptional regulator [Pedococcus sp.]|jgi:LacI family transcriptional regulator